MPKHPDEPCLGAREETPIPPDEKQHGGHPWRNISQDSSDVQTGHALHVKR
ncbi:unnamed protein product [Penicillium roqueforti FM164]|uniref:Str. FM013 n=2 Tax=Penicillium TaxID=5073 RepID=A0A0G4PYJ9_PENC3|nr:unnamed protein product [Penicillium roqueforti FM164]CRL31456.1 unnamed protein product [Penicillium camemberti]